MASEENIYFLRSFLILIEGGSYIAKEILNRECKKPNTDLDELLNENIKKLKHSFHVNQFKKLYPKSGKVDINNWDLQLSVVVLINLFRKGLKPNEKEKLIQLKDLRNEVYMHCPVAALDKSKYEDVIEDLEDSITTLAATFDISVQQRCSNCIKQFTSGPLDAVRPSLRTLSEISQSCQRRLKVGVRTELVIGGPSTDWIDLVEHTLVAIFNHAESMASEDGGFKEIEEHVKKLLSYLESIKAVEFKGCERKCIILFFECKDYESFLNFLHKVECQEYKCYLGELSNSLQSFFKPRNPISITSKVTSECLQLVLIDIIKLYSNEEEGQRHVVEISSEENIYEDKEMASCDVNKETKLVNKSETCLFLNHELISLEALPQMLQSFHRKQFSDSLMKVAGSLSRFYGVEITLKASVNVGAVFEALEESVYNEVTVDKDAKKPNTSKDDDFLLLSVRKIQEMIKKKKREDPLSKDDLENFVRFATQVENSRGKIADDAITLSENIIGEMLREIYDKTLNDDETEHLTNAMINSGEILEWPGEWKTILVDKHSTGGVGDKVSLVLAPVLAACGLKVPMISGRALEHTGGTLDKLESIPGFNVEQNHKNMLQILSDVGCCIVSQSEHLVPADKILYRMRDKTNTVYELGLITGSIISKKVVESLQTLVLDVKFGDGAFCKTQADAEELAIKMVNAGNRLGVKTKAVLTDMNSPLGKKVGNALEVAESIQCLQGKGPQDLTQLVKDLAVQLLVSAKNMSTKEAFTMIDETLKDHTAEKSALAKFKGMMIAQGVDKDIAKELCDHNNDVFKTMLFKSNCEIQETEIKAKNSGYVHGINALTCGEVTKDLRSGKDNADGNTVGLELVFSVGDEIKEGMVWVKVYHHGNFQEESYNKLSGAIKIKKDHVEPEPNKRAVWLLEEENGEIKKSKL